MKRSHTSKLKCPRVRAECFAHSGSAWITLASVRMDLLEDHPDPHLAESVLQRWQCLQIGRWLV